MARAVGVVRAGEGTFLAVTLGDGDPETGVLDGVGDVWARYGERADRILVALPVGLLEEDSDRAVRPPDRLARQVLGPRADAVDDPPTRGATRKRRYPAARRLVERTADRSLSRRAFERSDAVADLDELLREVPEARDTVTEAHPEVCARALAGDPLSFDPGVAAGYAERLRALAEFDAEAPAVVQSVAAATEGAPVPVAAVLDATALAYTGRPGPGELRSLPADPPTDPAGLPVRTVYRAPESLPTE